MSRGITMKELDARLKPLVESNGKLLVQQLEVYKAHQQHHEKVGDVVDKLQEISSLLTPLVDSLRAAIDVAKGEQLKARRMQKELLADSGQSRSHRRNRSQSPVDEDAGEMTSSSRHYSANDDVMEASSPGHHTVDEGAEEVASSSCAMTDAGARVNTSPVAGRSEAGTSAKDAGSVVPSAEHGSTVAGERRTSNSKPRVGEDPFYLTQSASTSSSDANAMSSPAGAGGTENAANDEDMRDDTAAGEVPEDTGAPTEDAPFTMTERSPGRHTSQESHEDTAKSEIQATPSDPKSSPQHESHDKPADNSTATRPVVEDQAKDLEFANDDSNVNERVMAHKDDIDALEEIVMGLTTKAFGLLSEDAVCHLLYAIHSVMTKSMDERGALANLYPLVVLYKFATSFGDVLSLEKCADIVDQLREVVDKVQVGDSPQFPQRGLDSLRKHLRMLRGAM